MVGIPQGVAVSAILANAYMLEFDKKNEDYVDKFNGLYSRYSDDIIIVCNNDNYKKIIDYIILNIKKEIVYTREKTEIRFF